MVLPARPPSYYPETNVALIPRSGFFPRWSIARSLPPFSPYARGCPLFWLCDIPLPFPSPNFLVVIKSPNPPFSPFSSVVICGSLLSCASAHKVLGYDFRRPSGRRFGIEDAYMFFSFFIFPNFKTAAPGREGILKLFPCHANTMFFDPSSTSPRKVDFGAGAWLLFCLALCASFPPAKLPSVQFFSSHLPFPSPASLSCVQLGKRRFFIFFLHGPFLAVV